MGDRELQVSDAGFEIIHEADHGTVVFAAIVGNETGSKLARNRPARRLISRLGSNF
jgi:hypothetical protein